MSVNERYIQELKKFLPDPQNIDDFLKYCEMPLKKSIKINLNKISLQEFEDITSKR